jgi:hypothetical protein
MPPFPRDSRHVAKEDKMTTTPTLWSKEITLSHETGIGEPRITALANDGFAFGFELGGDISGFVVDPFGSFTTGNLLIPFSSSQPEPLSGAQFLQQTNGTLVVEFRATFSDGMGGFDNDILWHLADSNADPLAVVPIENSTADAFLHDATAAAAGGTAVVF